MSQGPNPKLRGGGAVRGGRSRGGGRGGVVKKGGPAPARHIPWPEIFKHHISLVEGHLKMIDMVRKHTVEGSGNHRTIMSLVERAKSMLKDAKTAEREFVAPREAWRNIPIGSSSDTMYPGYSPKDHQYGKAAEEFGKSWSEARKKGIEFNTGPNGPEYEFGQSKAAKRRRITDDEPVQAVKEQATSVAQAQDPPQANGQLFYFDSNPAPVNARKIPHNMPHNYNSEPSFKKAKSEHAPEPIDQTQPGADNVEPVIEYDNIDREVDARLKLKEDGKRSRMDKKRKRDSEDSVDDTGKPQHKGKPVKKKNKGKSGEDLKSAASADNALAVAGGHTNDGDVEMQDTPNQLQADVGTKEASSTPKSSKKSRNKNKDKGKTEKRDSVDKNNDQSNKKKSKT